MANALHAYTANVDNLPALSEAVELMAEKHVSFHILPEHYDIVGECLLEAIEVTLKADKTVLDAFAEGYKFLANLLIDKERSMRESRANEKG